MANCTYASVSFDVAGSPNARRPPWTRKLHVSREHYPETNLDEVQFGGKGNFTIKVRAVVYSQANLDTLLAAWGSTSRALTLWSVAQGNAYLTDLVPVEDHEMTDWHYVDLTFERESA